jgi:hypothetical protein
MNPAGTWRLVLRLHCGEIDETRDGVHFAPAGTRRQILTTREYDGT